jgi:hypothetical protein
LPLRTIPRFLWESEAISSKSATNSREIATQILKKRESARDDFGICELMKNGIGITIEANPIFHF